MILFLDFDGVLHPEPCYQKKLLFCHLPRLEAILRDAPQVEVVISSSWKDIHTLAELQELFSEDIRRRVIDVTPHWKNFPELTETIGDYSRQVEIEAWLRQSGRLTENWIALDDREFWFQPSTPNLVTCDYWIGMSDETEAELRRRFR